MGARIAKSYSVRVLVYFLVASLTPLIALSTVLTSIAQSALEGSLDERGRTAAWAFSERVAEIERGLDASLETLATNPEILRALAAGSTSPAEASAVQRLLAREAQANDGAVFSLAPIGGGRSWSTGDFPVDWDMSRFSLWGLPRRVREAGGRTALMALHRISQDGRVFCLAAGRLVRSEAGENRGMIAVEVPREVLVAAAGGDRELLAFDAEILGRGGIIAFSLSDPSREGSARELTPFPPPAGSGIYEARLGELIVRLVFPRGLVAGLGSSMRQATAWGLGAAALGAALLALLASRLVTKPVLKLAKTMERVRAGELGARVEVGSRDELGHLAESFNEMSAELRDLVAAAVERGELLRRAELDALAARMNPHFLYNTLNSIKSLAKLGMNAEIVATVSRLGKLLRASAAGAGEGSTVGAEIELARDYLEIERIRYGERMEARWDIDPRLERLPLPGLVLEPLVENAILHGLERCVGPWHLVVRGWIEGELAVIAFEDDGPGADRAFFERANSILAEGLVPEAVGDSPGLSQRSPGIGLAATNRRLRLRFGAEFGLRVAPAREDGRGFRVELRLPAEEGLPCIP